MSHHRLKQQMDKQKQTIDPKLYSRSKKAKKMYEEEEDWERFNEELSYKSGYSRRSSHSQHNKIAHRVNSAAKIQFNQNHHNAKDKTYEFF